MEIMTGTVPTAVWAAVPLAPLVGLAVGWVVARRTRSGAQGAIWGFAAALALVAAGFLVALVSTT